MRTFHIILAFCVGLFTGYLFFDNNPKTSHSVELPTNDIAVKVTTIDTTKALADAVFKKRSDLLSGQLLIVNGQLKESRVALQTERRKIKVMQALLISDSNGVVCDSIFKLQVAAQIDTLNSVTDSLLCDYDNKVRLAESTIAVRDSQLVVFGNAYQDMKSLVQEQIARERQLTENLNIALKQQKKKRIQNLALAAGMLFVSGVTTSLLIKYKQ